MFSPSSDRAGTEDPTTNTTDSHGFFSFCQSVESQGVGPPNLWFNPHLPFGSSPVEGEGGVYPEAVSERGVRLQNDVVRRDQRHVLGNPLAPGRGAAVAADVSGIWGGTGAGVSWPKSTSVLQSCANALLCGTILASRP